MSSEGFTNTFRKPSTSPHYRQRTPLSASPECRTHLLTESLTTQHFDTVLGTPSSESSIDTFTSINSGTSMSGVFRSPSVSVEGAQSALRKSPAFYMKDSFISLQVRGSPDLIGAMFSS